MKPCPFCAEEIQDDAVKCKHCGEFINQPPSNPQLSQQKRLTRSTTDSMLGGVCGGIANYASVDSTIVRVAAAAIIIFTGIFPGLICYMVMVFVVPNED